MTKQSKFQHAYAKAKIAFDAAKSGYESELVATGLRARIDAATDEKTLDEIAKEDEPIFAKWNVKKLEKALSRAEEDLIGWSLDVAIALRPVARVELNSLRDTMKRLTRHDARKAECLRLAMTLPA